MYKTSKEKPRNLWRNAKGYQWHVAISPIDPTTESEDRDGRIVRIEDLEKRKEIYGVCEECNEPGTGKQWCKSCNAKRFKENFKNWTSGNKDIDELIQYSQLNAVYYTKCLEWIPYENFRNITYITRGGFGKIYSAERPEGYISGWDIENKKWHRGTNTKVVLKCLDNSSAEISTDFLNEIKSHLKVYFWGIIQCYGITQDPITKDYMMVLPYCKDGNLRNYYLKNRREGIMKINDLFRIANGLLDIHNARIVHKDFHSGNILLRDRAIYISDLGMCQSISNKEKSAREGVYGVLPYMAPEILRGYQYTRAADIYSFGIIMNEYLSEEIPFNDVLHDHILAIQICKGLRPKISEHVPKFFADLITKCWDAKAENRPTTKELYLTLKKWNEEKKKSGSEICSQMKEYDRKIEENKLKNISSENKSIVNHPQVNYTSRLLNFRSLPEPVNSSFQLYSDTVSPASTNLISECFDVQLSESDLNEIYQDENNVE